MALINIEKDGTTYSVNTQNVTYIVKYTSEPETYQVFVDGYDNAFIVDQSKYVEFETADYSGGGGGGGLTPEQAEKLNRAIPSNTISTMEVDGDTLTINGTPFEGGSAMVYNTNTNILSGAKDQDGNRVDFPVGTITIEF